MANNKIPTRQFVDIADIRGILVLLKDGSLRALVEVESVNFELKSSDEQVGILRGFQDFLNALDFQIEILMHSRKLDITNYLSLLDTTFAKLDNELLQIQATEYKRFVKGLSDLANIMEKRFFIVIPYQAIEIASSSTSHGIKDTLKGLFGSQKNPSALSDEDLGKYQTHMDQRISMIIAGLSPLGLKTKVLGQEDLMPLFSAYYNPPQMTQQ